MSDPVTPLHVAEWSPGEKAALEKAAPQEGEPIYEELGGAGLSRVGGFITEETLPQLRGALATKAYREMSQNDAVVGAILYAIDMVVRQVDWTCDPAEDTPEGRDYAEFVQGCMFDMSHSWEDFISEVLSMLVYGWAGFEIVYKKRVGPQERDGRLRSKFDDGSVGWRKLAIRAQETLAEWVFDLEDGGLVGLVQQAPPDFKPVFIPIEKLALFRTFNHKGNPEGRSILRTSYRAWTFKKRIEEIEGIGIERDLAGLPVIHVPEDILRADAPTPKKAMLEAMRKLVRNIRRDEQEGVLFPRAYDDEGRPLYELELLSSGGAREFDTSGIIERYDNRIAMTVLADFILLGHDATGSWALSSDKTDLFAVSLGTILKSISGVLNRHCLPRLFQVNGWDTDQLPVITPGDIEKQSVSDAFLAAETLSKIGFDLSQDGELEHHLRDVAGFPQREAQNTEG